MRTVHRAFVISLAVYNLGLAVPDLAHFTYPAGSYGYNGGSVSAPVVSDVLSHSAAADAGIETGDRIETQYLSLHDRLFAGTGVAGLLVPDRTGFSSVPFPGEHVTLRVARKGHFRTVTLVARPVYLTRSEKFWSIVGLTERVFSVTLGMALVLARPGLLTWIFYLWMLGRGALSVTDYFDVLPAPLWIAFTTPFLASATPNIFMPAMLWLHFPTGRVAGWRLPVRRFAIAGLIAGAIVGLTRCLIVAPLGLDSLVVDKAMSLLDAVGMALQVVAVITMWAQQRGFERRLYFWLMLIVTYLATLEGAWAFTDVFNLPPPPDINGFLWLGPLQTLFIAYAVLRHQMFDVEFVLSRTLVYAILTALTIGTLVAIDMALALQFHGSRIEVGIDIAAALALGFVLSSIHGRVVDLVDRVLFFRRFDSRRGLRATVGLLKEADSQLAIEKAVTVRAAEALHLTSAVFFRKVGDGGFLREFGTGWTHESPWHLLPGDKITELIAGAKRPIDLRFGDWAPELQASAPAAFAVPMRSDAGLLGVTFYGGRANGAAPSPDEVNALLNLSRRAADPYAFFERIRGMPARANARFS